MPPGPDGAQGDSTTPEGVCTSSQQGVEGERRGMGQEGSSQWQVGWGKFVIDGDDSGRATRSHTDRGREGGGGMKRRIRLVIKSTIVCPTDEAATSTWWPWWTHLKMLFQGQIHKGGWRYEGWRLRIVRETN